MVQAFRREKSGHESIQLNLKGLYPDARYFIKSIDSTDSKEMTGSELMNNGLDICIENCPRAIVFIYKVQRR